MKFSVSTFTGALFVGALVLFVASTAYAGPSHHHEHGHDHGHSHGTQTKLDDNGAIAAASKGVSAIIGQKQLIAGAALDAAWEKTASTAKSVSEKGKGYFIVKFDSQDTGKSLYLLLSDAGEVYDANYTGQFAGLKK